MTKNGTEVLSQYCNINNIIKTKLGQTKKTEGIDDGRILKEQKKNEVKEGV